MRLARKGGLASGGALWAIIHVGASMRAAQAAVAYHRLREAAGQKEGAAVALDLFGSG
jgi:hypothetical protein